MFKYVREKATKGDPQSVLNAIDNYCWKKGNWMANTGDRKGKVLDNAVSWKKPMKALELGSYCGYSSIRIARLLPKGAKLYSLEVNKKWSDIAKELAELAGL